MSRYHAVMNATYISPAGIEYKIYETTFINPGTGLETLLFVMVNESGSVVKATAASMEAARWIDEYQLLLDT